MRLKSLLAALTALFLVIGPIGGIAFAVTPDEVLDDTVLETRARALSANLRCMVCQNQSIDDSDAPLAKDLRVLVRERLTAGDSDAQVVDYLVSRYGEFVLLKPRFAWHNLILWAAGPLVLLFGLIWLFMRIKRRNTPVFTEETAPLSPEEQRKLDLLLAKNDDLT
ncbi:cytochrome c-type biogenesis protein [Roseibium algae]|uniref:Cytochrome c-type biogenesis protein n=1 Tax=Roseibium algae TaxID=3123038 RepID=A0ABU8TIJ1_9HYPH